MVFVTTQVNWKSTLGMSYTPHVISPVSIGISEGPATPIFLLGHEAMLPVGQTELRCSIPFLPLPRGRFYLWFGIIESTRDLVPWHPVGQFEVLGPELTPTPRGVLRMAPVQVTPTWEVEQR